MIDGSLMVHDATFSENSIGRNYRAGQDLFTFTVILAALVKPQFAVLLVASIAARQWRSAGVAVSGIAISNLAAYAV